MNDPMLPQATPYTIAKTHDRLYWIGRLFRGLSYFLIIAGSIGVISSLIASIAMPAEIEIQDDTITRMVDISDMRWIAFIEAIGNFLFIV